MFNIESIFDFDNDSDAIFNINSIEFVNIIKSIILFYKIKFIIGLFINIFRINIEVNNDFILLSVIKPFIELFIDILYIAVPIDKLEPLIIIHDIPYIKNENILVFTLKEEFKPRFIPA